VDYFNQVFFAVCKFYFEQENASSACACLPGDPVVQYTCCLLELKQVTSMFYNLSCWKNNEHMVLMLEEVCGKSVISPLL